jgi:probable rRNA maturation factor
VLGGDAEAFARRVLGAASGAGVTDGEVSVLLTNADEMRRLNREHRGFDKATNVLAFPAPPITPRDGDAFAKHWGDIALGYDVVAAEALAQGKTFQAHAAHLLTHGFLHLLGHDHETEEEAALMEARERAILAALGVSDPYAVERA